jgi:histidyl-tRNA synthetase
MAARTAPRRFVSSTPPRLARREALIRPVRGMHDVWPSDTRSRAFVERAARRVAQSHGFREVSTPVLEETALFRRTLGLDSDVVSKEMYTFNDGPAHRCRSLTLRPECTAGVMRALLTSGRHLAPDGLPQRLFYCGPMFRRERPQRGRLRQFRQFGIELLGAGSPLADVEAIVAAADFLAAVGLATDPHPGAAGVRLEVNTLGDAASRRRFESALREHFLAAPIRATLSDASARRLDEGSVLRILDSKHAADRAACASAPAAADFLSEAARARFDEVLEGLNEAGVAHVVNGRLARGLDYYSHTAFEFLADLADAEGSGPGSSGGGGAPLGAREVAVLAGGRYDGLAEALGARAPVPAVGWAAGVERLQLLRESRGLDAGRDVPLVAVAPVRSARGSRCSRAGSDAGSDARPEPPATVAEARAVRGFASQVARAVRAAGENDTTDRPRVGVWRCHEPARAGAQLRAAERAGCVVACLVGDEELARGEVTIKCLRTRTQTVVPLEAAGAAAAALAVGAGEA